MSKFKVGDCVKFATMDFYNGLTGKILSEDRGKYRCSVDQDHKDKQLERLAGGIMFSAFELMPLKKIKRRVV